METIIVTPQEIVKKTPLGGNVDTDKYVFLIPDQQRFVLEPILGTALLEKILNDITLSGIDSLTGHYATIVNNYCKDILINSVFAEYVNFGDVSIDNNGLFKVTPQDSQPVDETTILRIVKRYRQKAQVYVDRLERYLCDKGNEIPEYKDSQPEDYDIDPLTDSNIVGGLYLKSTSKLPWYLEDADK